MNYSKDLQRRRRWFRFNYFLILSAVLLIIAGLILKDWQPATPAYYGQHATDYLRAQQKLLTQPNILTNVIWVRGGTNAAGASLGESVSPNGAKTYRLTAEVDGSIGQSASIETSPFVVAPNTTYVYEDDYLASVMNNIEVETFSANKTSLGKQVLLRHPAASTSKRFSGHFTTAPDASLVVIRRVIGESGRLSIENQRLRVSTIGGFASGMVTLTFDGGYSSAYNIALQELQTNGMQASFYIHPELIDQDGRMTIAELQKIRTAGSELGSLGLYGRDVTGLQPQQKNEEIAKAREVLANAALGPADLFAAPFGKLDGEAKQLARRYYRSQRNLDDQAANYPYNFDPFAVKAFVVDAKTEPAEVANALKQTALSGGWLVLVMHDIGEESPENPSTISVERFKTYVKTILDSGVAVKSMSAGLDAVETYFKELP